MSRLHRYPIAPPEPIDDADDERPSKSARKRAAHAAQALGERLISLRESDLAKLPLPDNLLDAIRVARRIKAHGGLARQKQYIGKLMRDLDTLAIEAALAELR
jgi:ribosome-associated protein